MKKPILARALALVMSLSLLSTTAFAAVAFDPTTHVDGSGTLLSHEEETEDGSKVSNYDYYLTGDVELDKTLVIKDEAKASINLNGHTLSGNGNSSVIKVTGDGTSLTLEDTKVDGTKSGENGTITGGGGKAGGGIYIDDNATVTMDGGTIANNHVTENGGGVYMKDGGTFTMNDGAVLSGNEAGHSGGGVFVNNGYEGWDHSQFTMNGGVITENEAGNGSTGAGGGIGAYGYQTAPRTEDAVTINGGEIKGNRVNYSGGNGGGIAVQNGAITMTGGTVSGNTGVNLGGGLYVDDSSANISGATFTGNSTSANAVQGLGGGIYLNRATGTIENTTIGGSIGTEQNSANLGGGIYVGANSNITLNGNTISGNTASTAGGGIFATGNKTSVTMNSGIITGNTSSGVDYGGGGVYNYSGATFTMNGGEISGNTAKDGHGGGLFNHTATFVMTGGKLYGNTAGKSSDDIYSNIKTSGSIELIDASGMEVSIGNKNVSNWLWDGTDVRWTDGHYEIKSLDEKVLRLKAAHDQYFTVTYTDGNGTILQSSELENGSEFPAAPSVPAREGYTFTGWGVNLPETVTGNFELVAQWEAVIPPVNPGESEEPENPENPENPEEPDTPDEPGVTIPDVDVPLAGAPDAGEALSIEDEEVPLAGIVTLAEMLEELRQHEEIAEIELPEDFKFIDHDYAQALYWALAEGLVVDTEEDPLDPDEILTVGLMQKVLDNFVANYKEFEDFTVTVEGEADEMVMDLGERLAAFYADLEQAEAK